MPLGKVTQVLFRSVQLALEYAEFSISYNGEMLGWVLHDLLVLTIMQRTIIMLLFLHALRDSERKNSLPYRKIIFSLI